MSSLKDDKKKKGKQNKYVNYKVKELDEEMEENLFGDKTDEIEYDKFDHLVQLGNLRVNRTNFGNPQGTRVYSPKGTCPTVTLAMSTKFLIKDGGEYKIRRLSGFEEMRLMGVDDEDIQKLVDGGLSNNQLSQLAGNSIVVDVMSELYKEMIKY